MVEQGDTALPLAPEQGDTDTQDGDGENEHFPPFFSMSQRQSSTWNSWDAECAPSAKEPKPPRDFDLIDGERPQLSPQFAENKPRSEDNIDAPDGETNQQPASVLSMEQPSSNNDLDVGGTKQHHSALSSEPCNNGNFETWDAESKNTSLPSFRRQPQSVGAGLGNMGNTCFLNAILQCITHTVPLLLKLRSADHSTPCPYDKDGFCSFCALKEHIDESIRRSGSVLMPARFKDNLNKISADFRPGQQEDAHEFLRCLLDNLDKCFLDPKSEGKSLSFDEDSIVKQVFGGCLRSQLFCCECGHCSETFEPFLDLSLEIDQADHLVDALESFTKVEQIGDSENKLTCESCNAQVSKKKQLKLDKLPDVMAFQLKRFTTLDHSVEKIRKHVVYPLELDLKPFHSSSDNEGELKYDLYGVVEHCGLPNYGHYVCSIRSSPTTWHLMNDSLVIPINETEALNQEAYILFYVRQGLSAWFSSFLEPKEVLHVENTNGASPVSVLENIDGDCSTSSGEGNSSSSGDKLEKDEGSACRISRLCDVVAERCHGDAIDSTNMEQPSTPSPRHKRSFSDDSVRVFEVEEFADEETPLMPKGKPKTKKTKSPAPPKSLKDPSLDKNTTWLLKRMHGTRRAGILNCLLTQREAEHEARGCPKSEPVNKKKRKVDIPVLQH